MFVSNTSALTGAQAGDDFPEPETAVSLRRSDLFAREEPDGWDGWGDEVGKFSSAPTAAPRNAMSIRDDEQFGVPS